MEIWTQDTLHLDLVSQLINSVTLQDTKSIHNNQLHVYTPENVIKKTISFTIA